MRAVRADVRGEAMTGPRMLTFRQASQLLGCTIRTLHNWKTAGMRTTLNDRGRRVVREDELRKHHRRHLLANPVHQNRMRHADQE